MKKITKPVLKTFTLPLCTLRLNARTGDLCGLRWLKPALEVIAEPRLGENFRILLPVPGYEANYLLSSEQTVSRIEQTEDGIVCVYNSLRNARGKFDVAVRYSIRAVDGQVQLSIEVDNRTNHPLGEVGYGFIGGQQGIGNRQDTESLIPNVQSNLFPGLFQRFIGGTCGAGNFNFGTRHAVQTFDYPGMPMPWLDFYNRKRNLAIYYGDHDPEFRLSLLLCELHPFHKGAVAGDTWPTSADVPPGEPIGLGMGWVKMPYLKKGVFRAGPIVLQVHRGDWHEATRIYRRWFDRHFQVRRPATWLRKENAWQSVIISSPEDVIIHRFRDLPKLAADAKKYGVTTFEILGWDKGGIDRGYPEYTPDPRLGTMKEFKQALAAIKKMGVHPIIFANIQMADTATPLFKKKLHRYTIQGRWADDLKLWGYGEGTSSSRYGLAASNMTAISPAHPEVRALLIRQMRALVRSGAEGLQLDKGCVTTLLDFNPHLPTSPDRSLSHELVETYREIVKACRKEDPGFSLASEAWFDRALPYVDVSYLRMGSIDMDYPVMRYAFPEWTSTIFAENPGDFNILNNGMRYGLVWAMAARHYNDSIDEELTRPLARYLKELIRIRKRHQNVLFHGRFLDSEGAKVKGGPLVRHSVFESFEGTVQACVAVNFDTHAATVSVNWPPGEGKRVELCQPFCPNRIVKLPATFKLPPQTCAVLVTSAHGT